MDETLRASAARCIGCSIPLCRDEGCLLGNQISQFVEQVFHERWQEACQTLHRTNNFPEFTGRLCGSPCQSACVHARHGQPAPIRQLECAAAERAFAEGWIQPLPPSRRTGKKVAVLGSGPAALTVAQQLARAGHDVVVFEQDDLPGGILRRGVPGCELDPALIDRRLRQLTAEGVNLLCGVIVGLDIRGSYLRRDYDAICLALESLQSPAEADLLAQLGLPLDSQGRLPVTNFQTAESQVFAVDEVTSDLCCLAQAIRNGRDAAAVIDQWLIPEGRV